MKPLTSPDRRPIKIFHKFSELKPGETMYEQEVLWLPVDIEKIKQPILDAIENYHHGDKDNLVMASIDLTIVARLHVRTAKSENEKNG